MGHVVMYVRFLLSLRNEEDLLFERGVDLCHETMLMWWNRFGPMFAGDIRRRRVSDMKGFRRWRWHLDEMYVKLNGEMVELLQSGPFGDPTVEPRAPNTVNALRGFERAARRQYRAGGQ